MSDKETEETVKETLDKAESIGEKFKENGAEKYYLTDKGWVDEGGTTPAYFRDTGSYFQKPQGAVYKAPVETERQKFGQKEARQLELLFDDDIDREIEEREVEVNGLDFSVSQDKAFEALQKLLAQTNYQGDPEAPEKSTYDENRGGTYKLPGVFIKWTDYYEAYGLTRKKDGKYRGKQKKKAKEALKDLTQPWRITVKDIEEDKKVAWETPLINLTWEYENNSDIENQTEDKRLLIRYKPLFIDKIDRDNKGKGFYLFKPYDLHEEINEAVGSKRYSGAIPRFIWWLNSIDYEANYNEDYDYRKDPHKIGKEKLAYRLRLDTYVEARQWSILNERIEQACEVAKEINFLLQYEIEEKMVKLWLNPARCSRLKYRLTDKGDWPPQLTDDRE